MGRIDGTREAWQLQMYCILSVLAALPCAFYLYSASELYVVVAGDVIISTVHIIELVLSSVRS